MNATAMISGRCLCGAIRVALAVMPGPLIYCHCRQCRKSAGAPFLAVAPIAAADFHLHDTDGTLTAYRASAGKARYFCSRCGSPIYSRRDGAEVVRVRAGVLDLPATVAHGGHIFCADAAAWDVIDDALPRHRAQEPGRAAPAEIEPP